MLENSGFQYCFARVSPAPTLQKLLKGPGTFIDPDQQWKERSLRIFLTERKGLDRTSTFTKISICVPFTISLRRIRNVGRSAAASRQAWAM